MLLCLLTPEALHYSKTLLRKKTSGLILRQLHEQLAQVYERPAKDKPIFKSGLHVSSLRKKFQIANNIYLGHFSVDCDHIRHYYFFAVRSNIIRW